MMRSEAEAKKYDSAKSYAAEVVTASEKAISDGRAAALRSRDEATAQVADLKNALNETQTALDNARQVPRVQLDFDALTEDLDGARRDLTRAESAASANRPQEAIDISRGVRSSLGNIQNRISEGVRGASRKK
jgi:hypothetical protein